MHRPRIFPDPFRLQRIEQQPNLSDRQFAVTLPKLSFEITGLSYDGERKLTRVQKYKTVKSNDVKEGFATLEIEKLFVFDWFLTTYETLRDYQTSFAEINFSCIIFVAIRLLCPTSQYTTIE